VGSVWTEKSKPVAAFERLAIEPSIKESGSLFNYTQPPAHFHAVEGFIFERGGQIPNC